jgi:methyl-accepting chemotaxis protein
LQSAAEALGGLNSLIVEQNQSITASSASVEEMAGTINAVQTAVAQMKKQFASLVSVSDTGKQRQ